MSEDHPRPPLLWETQVAIGALMLLSLKEFHELHLFSVHSRSLGAVSLEAGNAILLLLNLSVLFGFLERSWLAWWVGVTVVGGIGMLILASFWPMIQARVPGQLEEVMRRIATVDEYDFLKPFSLKPFQALWTMAKIVLLLTVPVMLLLGRLRERLRRG